MIDGFKLTIPGDKLHALLEQRIEQHKRCEDRWAREQTRTAADQTDDEPLLPDDMCRNEHERHAWRIEVLTFLRDHIDRGETYRLGETDLEFGELLPAAPGSVEQDEFEERTRSGFALERIAKASESFGNIGYGLLADRSDVDMASEAGSKSQGNDEFTITRVDLESGPEVIRIERK